MKKTKISNVATGILSRPVLRGDPVFSQEDSLTKKAIKNEGKKQRKRNISENTSSAISTKPIKNQKEKGLKQSATKGVVKFLNMIVNYQENSNAKVNKSEINLNTETCIKARKAKYVESRVKPNRFGAVVGMH